MASRYAQQKPDPAIQRNIMRARRTPQRGGKAQSVVIATSLAATLLGWALFAHEDAQSAAAQAAATTPAVTVAAPAAGTSDIPVVSGLAGLWTSVWSGVTGQQVSMTTTPSAAQTAGLTTTTAITAASTGSTTTQAAVATTRSSR